MAEEHEEFADEAAIYGVHPRDEHLWTTEGHTGRASAPFDRHPCPCRSSHAPSVPWTHRHHIWPLYAGGPDTEENIAYVCPATHDWTHVIWRAFEAQGGTTPRRQVWPHYAYMLAVKGWIAMEDAAAAGPV